MGYAFSAAEVAFLRSAAAGSALADLSHLRLSAASLTGDIAQARKRCPDYAPALVETLRLRTKAAGKLAGAAGWLLTDDALQQATPTLVARHRAQRLAGAVVHDVTCSIGAELAELVHYCPHVVGSDLDPVRLQMAAHNLAGTGAGLVRADALRPVSSADVVIADPGRRASGTGRRTYDPWLLEPPLPDLLAAYRRRELVIKCAPGLDFRVDGPAADPLPGRSARPDRAPDTLPGRSTREDRALDWPGEVEIVSLDGGVREAVLWSPGLMQDGVRRRATVLTSTGASWQLTDREPDEIPAAGPGEWIINPDGAVVRAGLVRHYGARFGLWQLDPRIAYLTGNTVPPGVRGFRVLSRHKLDERALRAELSRLGCGTLEILVRGVDTDPDVLRKRLRLRGTEPYALVITRIGDAAVVFLCAAAVLGAPAGGPAPAAGDCGAGIPSAGEASPSASA